MVVWKVGSLIEKEKSFDGMGVGVFWQIPSAARA